MELRRRAGKGQQAKGRIGQLRGAQWGAGGSRTAQREFRRAQGAQRSSGMLRGKGVMGRWGGPKIALSTLKDTQGGAGRLKGGRRARKPGEALGGPGAAQ